MDSPPLTDPSPLSRSLGRYELVHLLGQGGMGEVYLAKLSGAAGFEKPCIVKTVLPALLKDGQFLDRFHHEAKVLVHLAHSSIAQVYDMGEAEGTYYMALEYVAGVDLAYLMEQLRTRGQQMPVPVALYLGQRIAEGLGYAHRKTGPDGQSLGIVHRDVSPHNVMVSYEGEVKVIDFGLAKSAARSKYTLPSTVMGKLGYMSPEQVRAEAVDHHTDLFSCGVVVWELLAGRPLVNPGTMGEMMAAMSSPTVPALHALRPDVDEALDAVMRRALAPVPSERYARCDDFARALNEQFLRTASSQGAEEVGNFVREVCPEAFASQRKLVSLLTSSSHLRRSPVPPTAPGAMNTARHSPLPPGVTALPMAEGGAGYEDTLVRVGLPAPSSPVPGPGAAPPPSLERQGPGRKGWAVALSIGALGLIGASVGVTTFVLDHSSERSMPPEWREGGPPPGMPPPPPGGMPPPYGGMPPPPHEGLPPPPPGGMPPSARVGAGGPPEAAPASGGALSGASAPVKPKPRETSATAPGKPTAARPHGGKFISVERTAPVLGHGSKHLIPRGLLEGLSKGMVLQVVEGPVREGKARCVGEATVEEIRPMRTSVSLEFHDRESRSREGELLVVLSPRASASSRLSREDSAPRAEAPPPEPPAPPPASAPTPAEVRTLLGRITASSLGGAFPRLEVVNSGDRAWNDCLLITGKRDTYRLGYMAPGRREVALGDFKRHVWDGRPVDHDRIRLQCDEGESEFALNY